MLASVQFGLITKQVPRENTAQGNQWADVSTRATWAAGRDSYIHQGYSPIEDRNLYKGLELQVNDLPDRTGAFSTLNKALNAFKLIDAVARGLKAAPVILKQSLENHLYMIIPSHIRMDRSPRDARGEGNDIVVTSENIGGYFIIRKQAT